MTNCISYQIDIFLLGIMYKAAAVHLEEITENNKNSNNNNHHHHHLALGEMIPTPSVFSPHSQTDEPPLGCDQRRRIQSHQAHVQRNAVVTDQPLVTAGGRSGVELSEGGVCTSQAEVCTVEAGELKAVCVCVCL